MLTVSVRTVILYAVSILAMRLMGKRQVGQLQPYEFVLIMLIADLASAPMEYMGTPLVYGLVPIVTLVLVQGVVAILNMKFTWARRMLCGGPSVIIRHGTIQYEEMKRMCYSLSDLMEELRAKGFLNVSQIEAAILETNGTLSVFTQSQHRPLTPKDMNIPTEYEGICMTLVMDGKVQEGHLQFCGVDQNWLIKQISPLGYQNPQDVLLASLDTEGKLFVQGKEKEAQPHLLDALSPEEVHW